MKTIYYSCFIVLAVWLCASCTKEEIPSFMGEPGINFTSQDYSLGDMPSSYRDPDDPDKMGYSTNFASHYEKGRFADKYDTVYVKAKLEGTLQDHPLRVNLAYEPVEGYETPMLVLPKDSVIKPGEYYVRMAVLVAPAAAYNQEYRAKITFDYANSDVVAGSEERQSVILTTSDMYEVNQENMLVGDENEWNTVYGPYIGAYGPVKVRFILSVFQDSTYRMYMLTSWYGEGYGFALSSNLETLQTALDEYTAKYGPLKEPDGRVVSFEPIN